MKKILVVFLILALVFPAAVNAQEPENEPFAALDQLNNAQLCEVLFVAALAQADQQMVEDGMQYVTGSYDGTVEDIQRANATTRGEVTFGFIICKLVLEVAPTVLSDFMAE